MQTNKMTLNEYQKLAMRTSSGSPPLPFPASLPPGGERCGFPPLKREQVRVCGDQDRHGGIPKTDLYVREASMVYSLYTDQSFVVDKRPIFYGFVNVEFGCYAEEGVNSTINKYLD